MFVEKIKQIKRYIAAKRQTEIYLKAFDEAASSATSYEEVIFDVIPQLCNAEFWLRQTEHEGRELKKLFN